jgi:hypothetical protein
VLLLVRLVRLVASIVLAILVVGILLYVLDANPSNTIVAHLHDWGRWLAGPFRDLFSPHDRKLRLAVNWGIAAVVYAIAASVVTRVLEAGSGVGPLGERRRVR